MSNPARPPFENHLPPVRSVRESGLATPLTVLIVSAALLLVVVAVGSFAYGDWVEREARRNEVGLREQWEVLVRWKLDTEEQLEQAGERIATFEGQISELREREALLRRVLAAARERGMAPAMTRETGATSIDELEAEIAAVVAEFARIETSLQIATRERDVLLATLNQAESQLERMQAGGAPDPDAVVEAARRTGSPLLASVGGEPDAAPGASSARPTGAEATQPAATDDGNDAATATAPADSTPPPAAPIVGELAELRERGRREQLALAELERRYRETMLALLEGDAERASAELAAVREWLDTPRVTDLPGITSRRSLDLLLIGTLDRAIRRPAAADLPANAAGELDSLAVALDLLERAALLAEGGAAGRATELLADAFAGVPALRDATDAAVRADAALRAEAGAPIVEAAARAGSEGDAERTRELVASYLSLLPAADRRALGGLVEALTVATVAELEGELGEARALAASLADERDGANERGAALEARLAEREREIEELAADLTAIAEALERVAASGTPEALAGVGANAAAGESPSGAGGPRASDAAARAAELATAARAATRAVALASFDAGVEESVAELRRAVGYLDGSLDLTASELLALLDDDPRIRQALIEIQELGRVGLAREELPLGQLRFVGVIGSVGVNRVTVDLLTGAVVEEGDTIVFTRRDEAERESLIAEALVLSVDEERLVARVTTTQADVEPLAQDLAYVRVE